MKKLIESGVIKRTVVTKEKYQMYILDETNISEMIKLQNEVARSLIDRRIFAKDSSDFILNEVLRSNLGIAIGVFADNILIAFRTISFPGNTELNLGRELNIPDDELPHVAHLEATVVHPQYRGNRLQAKMMKHTLDIIDELGHFHILCTVSPFNYPSLKNVMDSGLTIKALGQREGPYEGRWRYLLHRDTRYMGIQQYDNSIEVENRNLQEQQVLLHQGFVGFLLSRENYVKDEFIIHYGVPL